MYTLKFYRNFFAAVFLTVIVCGFSRFQANPASGDFITWQAFFLYSRADLVSLGESACSYAAAIGFRDSDWFILFLPLISAIPSIFDFSAKWMSGYYYFQIAREKRSAFAIHNSIRAVCLGSGAVMLGIVLYIVILYIRFPLYASYAPDPAASGIALTYGADSLKRGLLLLRAVFHTGLLAAVASLTAMLFLVLLKDTFLSLSSLVLIEYVSMKLDLALGVYIIQHHPDGQEYFLDKLLYFLLPSGHLHLDFSFETRYGMSYVFYCMIIFMLILFLSALFYQFVRRRND